MELCPGLSVQFYLLVLLRPVMLLMPSGYKLVITRARGMYGIYCAEARGRKPRGLSAICAMHPE